MDPASSRGRIRFQRHEAKNNAIEIVDGRDGNKVCFSVTGTGMTSGGGEIETMPGRS